MSVYPASARRRKAFQWKSSPYPVRAGSSRGGSAGSSEWQQGDSGKGKSPKGKGNVKQAEMDHDEYHDNRIALNLTPRQERERKAFLQKLAAVPLG